MDRLRQEVAKEHAAPDVKTEEISNQNETSAPKEEKVLEPEKKKQDDEAMDTDDETTTASAVPSEPLEDPIINELDPERHSVIFHLGTYHVSSIVVVVCTYSNLDKLQQLGSEKLL